MITLKNIAIVLALVLAGAFLNSKHSPTNAVCDRIVDRTVEFGNSTQKIACGLAGDVTKEAKKEAIKSTLGIK